ncbi:MAG TPA: YHS domain-containing protein [Candidatus Limnocylindria bacterium]
MTDERVIESDSDIEIDPVCGMRVELLDAMERSLSLEFEGRQYVFCGPSCRERFERAPKRYATAGRAEP